MYFLYNLILTLVLVLLVPVWAVILLSAKKFRAGFKQKCGFFSADLKHKFVNLTARPVWFHAVSVGECLAVADLVKEFHRRNPAIPLVVSTVTYTGQEIAKTRLGDISTIIYFPYDLWFVVNKVIKMINPALVVIVETEIWPGFSFVLNDRKVPLLLINGRLSPKSYKNYLAFSFFFKSVLRVFTRFLMQSQLDADRIMAIGALKDKVEVVGNLKYDIKAKFTAEDIKNLKRELALSGSDKVLIAGSTHSGEEATVLEVYQILIEDIPELKLILVPRHPERYEEVINLVSAKGLKLARRTLKNSFKDASVFMLDTMGELSGFYSIADVAFIGGSLIEKGGHNPLEPAVYSVPVVVGKHTFNFIDITNYMLEAGAAIQVNTREELLNVFRMLLTNPGFYEKTKMGCLKVFDANCGATEKTLNLIKSLIS